MVDGPGTPVSVGTGPEVVSPAEPVPTSEPSELALDTTVVVVIVAVSDPVSEAAAVEEEVAAVVAAGDSHSPASSPPPAVTTVYTGLQPPRPEHPSSHG